MNIDSPQEFLACGLFCRVMDEYLIAVIVTAAETMAPITRGITKPVMAVTECMLVVRISTKIHMSVAMPPIMTMIPSVAVMIPVTVRASRPKPRSIGPLQRAVRFR